MPCKLSKNEKHSVVWFQSYDHADLRGRDMSGQDLHGAVFAGMTFTFESDRSKTDHWPSDLRANWNILAKRSHGWVYRRHLCSQLSYAQWSLLDGMTCLEVWSDCSACDCRKINLKGSNLDGSTDTFAGFEGSNLQDSSWLAFSFSWCMSDLIKTIILAGI